MTTAVLDSEQARIEGLLGSLRAAEAEYRRAYARVLDVVAELESERAGAITGFGTTARLLSGTLNLSAGEARVRVEHAELLTARRSLTGQELPPVLPATAEELAAGAIGPSHLRVITATMRRIPPTTHPDEVAAAEQTLAHLARRFDPPALTRLAERLLDTGGQLCAAEARRLACDAAIVPMVLGGDSMPLDVGREQRLATPAQRTALTHRDKGCAFPSCDRAPRYCHAHHIVHWLDGGETTLTNLCLLCEYHHTIVHRQGWHIRIDGRGQPEFTPPKVIDPTRTPLHNPLRQ